MSKAPTKAQRNRFFGRKLADAIQHRRTGSWRKLRYYGPGAGTIYQPLPSGPIIGGRSAGTGGEPPLNQAPRIKIEGDKGVNQG